MIKNLKVLLCIVVLALIQKTQNLKIPDITLHEEIKRNCITPKKIFSEISNKFILQNTNINDLFQQPRAVLLFPVIDALSPSICNDGSSLTRLTNLVTGVKVKQHGIFGDFWLGSNGEKIKAYSNDESWSGVDNLATLFEKKFEGKSLTVSVSNDESFAKAVSVKNSGGNNVVIFTKEGKISHEFFHGKKFPFLVQDSLLNELGCSVKKIHHVLCDGIEFDLKRIELAEFFKEFYLFFGALELGKMKKSGNAPDLYTFVSHSLRGILEKYGASSVMYTTTSKLLFNSVIPKLKEIARRNYEGRIYSRVFSLGRSNRFKKRVFDILKDRINVDDLKDYYPNIYLPTDLANEKKIEICNSLKSIDEQLSVNCDTENHFVVGRTILSLDSIFANNQTNSSNIETKLEIMNYQVTLWVAILFIFWTIMALYAISAIDYSQDFLLYAFDEKVKKVK